MKMHAHTHTEGKGGMKRKRKATLHQESLAKVEGRHHSDWKQREQRNASSIRI